MSHIYKSWVQIDENGFRARLDQNDLNRRTSKRDLLFKYFTSKPFSYWREKTIIYEQQR
jgi:hypothetical protein